MNEVRSLENLARCNLQGQYFETARNMMERAQAHWRPELGARPAFSDDELQQLDAGQVRSLEDLARCYLQDQFFDAAHNAMGRAQAHWRPGLGVRPVFSAEEQRRIEIIPSFGQRLNSREDLNRIIQSTVTFEEPCAICLDNMSLGEVVAKGRQCVHLFHHTSIRGWVMEHNGCPFCRQEFV